MPVPILHSFFWFLIVSYLPGLEIGFFGGGGPDAYPTYIIKVLKVMSRVSFFRMLPPPPPPVHDQCRVGSCIGGGGRFNPDSAIAAYL